MTDRTCASYTDTPPWQRDCRRIVRAAVAVLSVDNDDDRRRVSAAAARMLDVADELLRDAA